MVFLARGCGEVTFSSALSGALEKRTSAGVHGQQQRRAALITGICSDCGRFYLDRPSGNCLTKETPAFLTGPLYRRSCCDSSQRWRVFLARWHKWRSCCFGCCRVAVVSHSQPHALHQHPASPIIAFVFAHMAAVVLTSMYVITCIQMNSTAWWYTWGEFWCWEWFECWSEYKPITPPHDKATLSGAAPWYDKESEALTGPSHSNYVPQQKDPPPLCCCQGPPDLFPGSFEPDKTTRHLIIRVVWSSDCATFSHREHRH